MFWRKKKAEEKPLKIIEDPKPQIPDEAFFYNQSHDSGYSIDLLKQWNTEQAIRHMPTGFAMDSMTREAYLPKFENINQNLLNYYISSSSFIGYQALGVIGQHWLVHKGCFQKVRDAMRRGFTLATNDGKHLSPEDIQKIKKQDERFKLHDHMISAVGMNNIFGIRHILFKHKNPNFNYEKPFNPDAFKNGNYDGMKAIDPYWVTPEFKEANLSDPVANNFYEPDFWVIQGKRYHKSHFIVLKGDEVADILKPTYRYGGLSMCQRIYERVYSAERTANEAPQLVMTKRLNARKVDLAKAMVNKGDFVNKMKQANLYRDNHGWLIYGKDEEIVQLETNLSQLSDVITNQYEIVANIVDVPVSKLLGTGNTGFGGAETDDDYYLGSLSSLQLSHLEPIAREHYLRLLPSMETGIDEVQIIWNPLKVMSEKEVADMNYVKSQTALNEYNIGAVDPFDERDRLIKDQYSQYVGIEEKSLDELIEQSNENEFITPDNGNFKDGGTNSAKEVNGDQHRAPSQNSAEIE